MTHMRSAFLAPLFIAIFYGLGVGAVAALVLWAMNSLTDIIWHHEYGDTPLYIFGVIMAGGLFIALLRHHMEGRDPDLAEQIEQASHSQNKPDSNHFKDISLLAIMAIIAVAFGGAIGPEAGILAVIMEMSALVSLAIARSKAEQKLIGDIGVAAALGGLYASPPGGALISTEDTTHHDPDKDGEAVSTDKDKDTRFLLFLAGVCGFIGFFGVGSIILGGDGMRITLPEFARAAILSVMMYSLLPALLGGLTGLLFISLLPVLRALLARTGGIFVQTLVGTALFALLASLWPILRFSGHHELVEMTHWAASNTSLALALALLKVTALTICVASGWKGGAIFPLLFAGAAAGAVVIPIIPPELTTAALIAAMCASATVGMGKPIAALLIVALLIAPFAAGPLIIGALVGLGLSRIGPKAELH